MYKQSQVIHNFIKDAMMSPVDIFSFVKQYPNIIHVDGEEDIFAMVTQYIGTLLHKPHMPSNAPSWDAVEMFTASLLSVHSLYFGKISRSGWIPVPLSSEFVDLVTKPIMMERDSIGIMEFLNQHNMNGRLEILEDLRHEIINSTKADLTLSIAEHRAHSIITMLCPGVYSEAFRKLKSVYIQCLELCNVRDLDGVVEKVSAIYRNKDITDKTASVYLELRNQIPNLTDVKVIGILNLADTSFMRLNNIYSLLLRKHNISMHTEAKGDWMIPDITPFVEMLESEFFVQGGITVLSVPAKYYAASDLYQIEDLIHFYQQLKRELLIRKNANADWAATQACIALLTNHYNDHVGVKFQLIPSC